LCDRVPAAPAIERHIPGSPVSRLKSGTDVSGIPGSVWSSAALGIMKIKYSSQALQSPSTSSQSKVPSKLRDSSTASLIERSSTPSSRFSSPGLDSPGSSSYSVQSLSLTDRGLASPTKNARPIPNILPAKPSPPRQVVDDYLLGGCSLCHATSFAYVGQTMEVMRLAHRRTPTVPNKTNYITIYIIPTSTSSKPHPHIIMYLYSTEQFMLWNPPFEIDIFF
jgi:hypothetical protein